MPFSKQFILFFLFVSAIFITDSQLFSQEIYLYKKLINEGNRFLDNNDFDSAIDKFEEAADLIPQNKDAYLYMGNAYFNIQDWGAAIDHYNEITDINPDYVYAYYQMGICYREDGHFTDPIRRLLKWNKAEDNFDTAMQIDSTFKNIYYEYAILRMYQKEYLEAVELCQKQLEKTPFFMKARVDIFSMYDLFITYGSADVDENQALKDKFSTNDADMLKWLMNGKTEYDRFFVGEKYRRMGEYQKADSIFTLLANSPLAMSKVPVYLAQVRLFYEMNMPEKAEVMFWEALNNINDAAELTFVFSDLKYIMNDSDLYVNFKSLKGIPEYYARFWNKKNTYPGSKINMRMEEHYKRLMYAESKYRFDEVKLDKNNPDVLRKLDLPAVYHREGKFNDKGLVYIRYGEPDKIAVSMGQDFPNNESWLYEQTQFNPQLIFHFEVAERALSNDWRLVSIPGDPKMIESRLGWDPLLDQYYSARTPLEVDAAQSKAILETQNTVIQAMSYERPRVDKNTKLITTYFNTVQLKDDLGEDYINVYMSIPSDELKSTGNTDKPEIFETNLVLQDILWNNIFQENRKISISPINSFSKTDGYYVDVFSIYPKVNKYYIATYISDLDGTELGGQRFLEEVKPFSKQELDISDLVLAYDVSTTDTVSRFTKNGLNIVANPSFKFNLEKPVYFYFEIYNLSVVNGLAEYKIEQTVDLLNKQTNLFTSIGKLFGGGSDQTLKITRDQQNPDSTAIEYIAVDFKEMETGTYKVSILVTDKNTLHQTETSAFIELF